MIDLRTETILTLKAAAAVIPPGRGHGTHVSTILRWIHHGVKLEAVRLGGRWVTSREALQRFAERGTDCSVMPDAPMSGTGRNAQEVERELERLGI